MTGSIVLDVVISLVFLYLIYSLFASIFQEVLATLLGFRAKVLEKALLRMLEDGKITTGSRYGDRIKGFLHLFGKKVNYYNKPVATSFYTHPLIKYLAEDNYYSKPAYINAQDFSKVMIDLLGGIVNPKDMPRITEIARNIENGTINTFPTSPEDRKHPLYKAQLSLKENAPETWQCEINIETRLYLKSLLLEAQYDIEKFRFLLENWFDSTMERATGWYKRYTQLILLIIGLMLSVIFNVDTITIARKLTRDPELREQMVQSANQYLEREKELSERIAELRKQKSPDTASAEALREKLIEHIGRTNEFYEEDLQNLNQQLGLKLNKENIKWYTPFGWLLTAFAISLGAPFWFDLLNRLVKIRGAGTKIDTEAGKDVSKQSAIEKIRQNNLPEQKTSEEAVG